MLRRAFLRRMAFAALACGFLRVEDLPRLVDAAPVAPGYRVQIKEWGGDWMDLDSVPVASGDRFHVSVPVVGLKNKVQYQLRVTSG